MKVHAAAGAEPKIPTEVSLWTGNPLNGGLECSDDVYRRQPAGPSIAFQVERGQWNFLGLHDSAGNIIGAVPTDHPVALPARGSVKVALNLNH